MLELPNWRIASHDAAEQTVEFSMRPCRFVSRRPFAIADLTKRSLRLAENH